MLKQKAPRSVSGSALSRALPALAMLALALLLIAGVVQLCVLRFNAGDLYPPLSTLRGDPLGAKVLFDALSEVEGLETERNYRPLEKLFASEPGQPFTLFYIGADLDGSVWDWDDLARMAIAGNRVALIFAPAQTARFAAEPLKALAHASPSATPSPKSRATPSKTPEASDEEIKLRTARRKRLRALKGRKNQPSEFEEWPEYRTTKEALERIGVQLHFEKRWEGLDMKATPATEEAGPPLSWHSVAWFELGPKQRALYLCKNKPVIVECPFGKGSIVLASDSFFATNEGLRNERAPKLLAALVGDNRRVVFDEFNHGVEASNSVVMLIHKYRLDGVLGVFLLLVALHVWKNAVPLLPRTESAESAEAETVAGRSAEEGFVNLLRRAIPPGEVVAACAEEWNKAFARKRGRCEPPSEPAGNPVQQFADLAETISKRPR